MYIYFISGCACTHTYRWRHEISKTDAIDDFSGLWEPWNIARDMGLLSKSDKKSLRSSGHFHLFDSIEPILKTDWDSTNSLNCVDACCMPGSVPGNEDFQMKGAHALPWAFHNLVNEITMADKCMNGIYNTKNI